MPQTYTQTITTYSFDELDDTAKERARDWWRSTLDNEDFKDGIYEYADTVAQILGIEIDRKHIPLMNGGTRTEPRIWWQGFSSQGDGACFEGHYAYKAGWRAALVKYLGKPNEHNSELFDIGTALQETQKPFFYNLEAQVSHHGHYYHSGCTHIGVNDRDYPHGYISDTAQDNIRDALRAFMDWIYSCLDAENDHINSDENVDENIRANEYEFRENGEIY